MDHEQGNAGAAGAERHAYRDDMGDSYSAGYTTRSSDEGYGEIYSEAVKAVLDKKADKAEDLHEMQSGMTANRDQSADAGCIQSTTEPRVLQLQERKMHIMLLTKRLLKTYLLLKAWLLNSEAVEELQLRE